MVTVFPPVSIYTIPLVNTIAFLLVYLIMSLPPKLAPPDAVKGWQFCNLFTCTCICVVYIHVHVEVLNFVLFIVVSGINTFTGGFLVKLVAIATLVLVATIIEVSQYFSQQ